MVEDKIYQSSLWEPFNETKLNGYIENNKIVLVDITAEWCLICKANKFFVLEQRDILKFLKEKNVVLMRGDYTNRSAILAKYLEKNNRYGIPLNVLYGPKNKEGVVLPELLTKDILVSSIKGVSGQ